MTEAELNRLLERFAPAIRDAVIAGIREIRDAAILEQLIILIERGDEQAVLRALGINPAVFSPVYIALMQAFEAGSLTLMAEIPRYVTGADGVRTPMRFNPRNPRAEAWLQQESSSLITGIEEDVRQSVRSVLQTGMQGGRNPRSVALDIIGRYNRETKRREGGVLGLNAQQVGWRDSVRQKLLTLDAGYFEMGLRDKRFDPIVQEAIDSGKPLSAETVDKLVNRYEDNALRHRGEMIGRTEALAAIQSSRHEAVRQAVEQSDIPLSAVRKVWDSAGDERVRHSHKELDGVSVGIDEPFVSPVTGARMLHPHDTSLGAPASEVVMCRCRVRYDIDFFKRESVQQELARLRAEGAIP